MRGARISVLMVLILFVTLASGCNAPEEADRTDTRFPAEAPRAAEANAAGGGGDEEPSPGDESFDGSNDSGGVAGAADSIRSVHFEVRDDFERVVVEFGAREGDVARVPEWSVVKPAEGGYLRVDFPGIDSTVPTGRNLVGTTIDGFYVVRDPEGGLFVDVFVPGGFRYRVMELQTGRLAVDFRPAQRDTGPPPTQSEKVVVLQPRRAEEVGSLVDVRGYARTFEASITVSLLDRERKTIASKTVRANDWTETWGYYEASLQAPPGYAGRATLRVGSVSPRDGAFEGAEVPIFFE